MVKIAVIGVGRWGQHFARLFAQHPGFELVALVDHNHQRCEAVRDKLQLPHTVKLLPDLASLLTQASVSAVMVATPAVSHYELIHTALSQGLHVLAEKPLTLNAANCLTLTQLATHQNVRLFVDHTYLFHPVIKPGSNAIAQLGNLRYGYATRTNLGPVRLDVDALWDLAIHDLALFNHWLGALPTAVRAWGQTWLQPQAALHDSVWATLHYPSGFTANCHWCWNNPDKQRRFGVVGDRGTLLFDEMNRANPLQILWGESKLSETGHYLPHNLHTESWVLPNQEPLQIVCDRFFESIQTGQVPPEATGETAATLVNILQGLTRSLQTGETIQFKNSAT